ncbi:MAG: MFS transporter [Candidatus Bathyarchaeota archaeon]|nr:MAG: MFS transporter [Candidatus Bathyarchaeota archaeon]
MDLRPLYLALIIFTMSVGILSVVIPLYSYSLSADSLAVGLIVSAHAIAHILASPLWGRASDRLGRRLSLGIGMLLSSVIVPLYPFMNDLGFLAVISFLRGLVDASFWIVPWALIADLYTPQELGQVFGKVGMIQGIGFIVGPFFGGFLVGQLNYPSIFYMSSAFVFSTALLVFFGVDEEPRVPTEKSTGSSEAQLESGAIARKSVAIAYVDTALSGLFLGVINSQFIIHASEILREEYLVGFLLTSYYLAETFVQPLAGRLSDMLGRHRTILFAFVICAIGFLALLLPPSFVSFLIATVIVGMGVGMLYIAPSALLMDATPPSQRGLTVGFYSTVWGIGFFLGPVLGGAAAIYSVGAPYILSTIASAMGGILALIGLMLTPKKRH